MNDPHPKGLVKKFFKNISTENDNLTYDLFRILAIAGVVVFFGLAIANHSEFNAIEFGTGFGAVLLAAGGAVRIGSGAPLTKSDPDPDCKPPE